MEDSSSSPKQSGGLFAGVGYFPTADEPSHYSKETELSQQHQLQPKPESMLR